MNGLSSHLKAELRTVKEQELSGRGTTGGRHRAEEGRSAVLGKQQGGQNGHMKDTPKHQTLWSQEGFPAPESKKGKQLFCLSLPLYSLPLFPSFLSFRDRISLSPRLALNMGNPLASDPEFLNYRYKQSYPARDGIL